MVFATRKNLEIWIQYKDNCVEMSGKLFDPSIPAPTAALFTSPLVGREYPLKAVTQLDATGTLGARVLDEAEPRIANHL